MSKRVKFYHQGEKYCENKVKVPGINYCAYIMNECSIENIEN
jgi:hypothetical protein